MLPLRAAALQYQFSPLSSFADFGKKISKIVLSLAKKQVKLIVFPEYMGYHLALLDKENDFRGCEQNIDAFVALFQQLADKNQLLIQAGTIPVSNKRSGYFNRAYLFCPGESPMYQDKIHLTPSEKSSNVFTTGEEIKIFDT